MKKFISFLLLLVISLNAQTNIKLQKQIEEYSNQDNMQSAGWSVYAKYVDEKKPLINLNSNKALAPASGLKIITSGVGLELLGKDYRLFTRIFYDGKLEEGILNGDIYFVGGGDPTLGSSRVEGSSDLTQLSKEIYSAFRKFNIKKINGNIFADALRYSGNPIPNNWYWIDIGNYYGTSNTALSLNDNLYELYFKPGKTKGDDAEVLRTEPVIPNLTFTNFMKTGAKGSGDNGYIFAAPNLFNAVLRGTVPAGVDEFSIKGSIPNPPLFTAQFLLRTLNENGIKVNGTANILEAPKSYSLEKMIFEKASPTLDKIVYIINKKSFNFYTEMLLKEIGFVKKGEGSTETGIEVVNEFLKEKNISTKGLNLFDGSGLSRSNAITTVTFVQFLDYMYNSKSFVPFYNSLGITGDVEDIAAFGNYGKGTSLEKNGRVKSGFIGGVRSHQGYVKNKDGRTISFSFIANNYEGSSSAVSKIHEKIMIELAELKK